MHDEEADPEKETGTESSSFIIRGSLLREPTTQVYDYINT